MSEVNDHCRVCLEENKEWIDLLQKDTDKVRFLTKLTTVVPQTVS